nr:MAG TPA: hypothetical protein [Caudoviricetes sp.]
MLYFTLFISTVIDCTIISRANLYSIIMIVICDVLMFQYKIVLTNMNIDIVRGVNADVYIYNIIIVMATIFISS